MLKIYIFNHIEDEFEEFLVDCLHEDACSDAYTEKCKTCRHNPNRSYYEPVVEPFVPPDPPYVPYIPPYQPWYPNYPHYPWYPWTVITGGTGNWLPIEPNFVTVD